VSDAIQGIEATIEVDGRSYEVLECTIVDAIDAIPELSVRITSQSALPRPAALLGTEAVLKLGPIEDAGTLRTFRGKVVRGERRLHGVARPSLVLVVSPDLFRLTKRTDVRTFQQKSVREIVEQVMSDAGAGKANQVLTGSYEPREFVVQYRETDFDFLRRLLAEEGVAFVYDHEHDETVFFDDPKGVGESTATTYYPEFGFGQEAATVSKLALHHEVRSDKVHLREYDFLRPRFQLEAVVEGTDEGDKALEIYGFPARSTKDGVVKQFAEVLLDAVQSRRHLVRGTTTVTNLYPAHCFKISGHPLRELEVELLPTDVKLEYRDDPGPQGARGGTLRTTFVAMNPEISRYRPARIPRAREVPGPQVAVTTGAPGEEIFVDEHGRVRVQFPWDRVGARDDKSSLPIRTGQLPTGGSMLLPRVGWEVLVQHDEGDVDLPLVMGRLYNQETMPPYALPAGSARTALQTATTPGGGSTNELRFDDSKGSEEMFFNASKDMTTFVKHNVTESVGANATRTIGANLSEEITNSLTTSIGGSDSESVAGNEKIAAETLATTEIGGDHSLTVGGNRDLKVGGDHKHTVAGAESLTVGSMKADLVVGKVSETTDANASLEVGAARISLTAGSHATEVAGNHTSNVTALSVTIGIGGVSSEVGGSTTTMMAGAKVNVVDADRTENAGSTMTQIAGGATIIKADNITMEADGVLTLLMGASIITLTPASISILGASVKLDGATAETAALVLDN
jgi:type VI secretion system secreted protein VgrG